MASKEKPLTANQLSAAAMVAAGNTTLAQIASSFGVTENTITVWKRLPLFQAEVKRLLDLALADFRGEHITDQKARFSEMNDRWLEMRSTRLHRRRVAIETGDAEKYPGAGSGLFGFAEIENTRTGEIRRAYYFDRFFAQHMLAIEDSAAEQTGQKVRRTEVSGPGGTPIQVEGHAAAPPPTFRVGVLVDVLKLAKDIRAAQRWPSTPEQASAILDELHARDEAGRLGLRVPGWEVVFDINVAKAEAEAAADADDEEPEQPAAEEPEGE